MGFVLLFLRGLQRVNDRTHRGLLGLTGNTSREESFIESLTQSKENNPVMVGFVILQPLHIVGFLTPINDVIKIDSIALTSGSGFNELLHFRLFNLVSHNCSFFLLMILLDIIVKYQYMSIKKNLEI